MKKSAFIVVLVLLGLFLSHCGEEEAPQALYDLKVPDHFADPVIPADNSLTVNKVALGKKLFFDPAMSLDSSISCASCHFQENAFADPRQFSLGVNGLIGERNAPALMNLIYGKSFFWDGANPALESQALFPLTAEFEMNNTGEEAIRRLNADPEYVALFQEAFGRDPDLNGFTKAIASFERTLISANSAFDRFEMGDENALSPSEKRGMNLFNGERAECFHCHNEFNFTHEGFENNGLYETYVDQGRWEVTGNALDIGKFKVPTLRNIEHTAPYMHDGSINTLEEVIDHYVSGGKNHPNKSVLIRSFFLSEDEKKDLLNFLKALSDKDFLTNPEFRP